MQKYLPLLIFAVLITGCDTEKKEIVKQEAESQPLIAFQTLLQTGVSGVEKAEKVFKVIKDPETLHRFRFRLWL